MKKLGTTVLNRPSVFVLTQYISIVIGLGNICGVTHNNFTQLIPEKTCIITNISVKVPGFWRQRQTQY